VIALAWRWLLGIASSHDHAGEFKIVPEAMPINALATTNPSSWIVGDPEIIARTDLLIA